MSLRSSDPIVLAAVAVAGVAAAAIDLRTRRVPNALNASIAAMGFALAIMRAGGAGLAIAAAGCALGLVCMLPGHLIGGTGGGDVKLFAAMGTLLGPRAIAYAFLYTALAGGVLACLVALTRSSLAQTMGRAVTLVSTGGANVHDIERQTNDNRFAYAPAIAIGVVAAALGV
jgi:prepilin peptidase CpaA